MSATLLPIIGELLVEGTKAWNEERRTRYLDKYHDILKRLNHAENRPIGEYTDYDVAIIKEELETFLKAYVGELKKGGVSNV
ncbi:hypothetical protein HBN50_07705 [Halobacteriovorax sp. GB3]|uniref:hypothetical protein n=1 Tax=Halobacteriovorax sp. GB3 TaxID=2719615 RepID=UPI00235F3467|nr:hypothetical protein [Halobacteriovorax sp. GB3]MDD0852976.1 hypothetical protein [Halobacteriovorax sp. GB3]